MGLEYAEDPRIHDADPRKATGLDPVRLSAWRAISCVRDDVYDELTEKMRTAAGIPVAWYEILLHLKESGNGHLRQTEIEERVPVGSSGVSRMLARMEQAGLVTRVPSPEDKRALDVGLTSLGMETVVRATPVYMNSVQAVLGGRLDDEEAATIARLLHRVHVGSRDQDPGAEHAHLVPFGETVLSITEGAVVTSDAIVVRNALEPLLHLEAAQNLTPEAEADMRAIVGTMSALLDQPEDFFRADWQLHRVIARLSRNTLLKTIYLSLLDNIESHLEYVVPTADLDEYLNTRLIVHARLVNAVCSGEPERVERAVREHHFTSARPVPVIDISRRKTSLSLRPVGPPASWSAVGGNRT
jgi:DNA-binding GntR family transcriptional regulator